MDRPVKGSSSAVHMSAMSNPRKTLTALAAAALILASATGCSDGQRATGADLSPAGRAAYEQAHFGTPDEKVAANLELARITAEAEPDASAAEGVANTLLNPSQWKARAHEKLCETTRALMNDADRNGTALSERTRSTAKLILDRC